jgi:eukaryotic-like serine/threonine-protein kinase
MALNVGDVVSGYTIEGVLGAGGMGTVYRARNPSLPRSDALKVLSSTFSKDPSFQARFTREAELAATLDHPNIVAVYSRGETATGELWIAMQYVAGSDADAELDAGPMPAPRALNIITEVAKALDYAHRRQVLHRDVKPANFLLANDDERVFLADFGIARALDETAGLTQTGTFVASIAYASPESLAGAPDIDHRTDIYSLGCSLYRLLTGENPFAHTVGMPAMIAAHLYQPPPMVTDLRTDLPPAIDTVIMKALAKDPQERYQSAGALAKAAGEALNETTTALPVMRPPPPPPFEAPRSRPPTEPRALTYPSGQFSGPQPRAMPPHYGGPAPQQQFAPPQDPRQPRHPGPPPRPARQRWPLIAGAIAAVIVIAAVVTGVLVTGGSGDQPGYQSQTFTHAHGTTTLNSAPTAVAALGPGDGDAVLSLGLQPVAIGTTSGALPSWEKSAITGTPKMLSGLIDTGAVAAAKPDLIIATGDVDDATYGKLAAIAPTITRPADATTPWTWQDQLTWVGKVVGRDAKAKELIDSVRSQAEDVKNQNPSFNRKSVAALTVSDDGVGEVLVPSNIQAFLESVGLRYDDDMKRTPADRGDSRPIDVSTVYQLKTEVIVVLRTDKAAGEGGYGGLPAPFGAYTGALVVADTPDVLAALAEPGGYLANEFLYQNFVPTMARQIR